MDMDEIEDLESLYSPSQWSKRYNKTEVLQKHIIFLEQYSKMVKEKIPCKLGVPYGPGQREKYDIYGTDLEGSSPIFIHIHGGYYQEESVTHVNNGFISNILYQNGIKTILLGYELCPLRTVGEIIKKLQIGLRKCVNYARESKSRGIYLSGHSVGAHAIATILTNFKRSIAPDDSDLIKAAFLLSGLYNLEPLTKTSVNKLLNISEDTAKTEFSPLFDNVEYGNTVIYVVAAENDSPAFVKQAKEFYGKLQSNGTKSYLNIIPEVDHYDIVENLYDNDFELTKIIVNCISNNVM